MIQETDRELLQWAAKAANCGVRWEVEYGCYSVPDEQHGIRRWNPLNDEGDALRLAVKLRIGVTHNDPRSNNAYVLADGAHFVGGAFVGITKDEEVDGESSRAAATRRAIVRAAAEIGKAMP